MPNGKMSCFADTNLIVYTVDPQEPEKRSRAKDFLNLDHQSAYAGAQPAKPKRVLSRRNRKTRIDAKK